MTITPIISPSPRPNRRQGFTLVELLLAVVLALGLMGAVVFNFSSFSKGAQLDEGSQQVEALFRFARAHAASTGRQVRVEFGEPALAADAGAMKSAPSTNKTVRVTWEPNPLEAPGVFEVLNEAANYVERICDAVNVCEVRMGGSAEAAVPAPEVTASDAPEVSAPVESAENVAEVAKPAANADGTARDPMPSVTFYPDGSGDSVRVVLASRDEVDERRMSVRMVGVTGSIQRRVMLLADASAGTTRPAASAPEAKAEARK